MRPPADAATAGIATSKKTASLLNNVVVPPVIDRFAAVSEV